MNRPELKQLVDAALAGDWESMLVANDALMESGDEEARMELLVRFFGLTSSVAAMIKRQDTFYARLGITVSAAMPQHVVGKLAETLLNITRWNSPAVYGIEVAWKRRNRSNEPMVLYELDYTMKRKKGRVLLQVSDANPAYVVPFRNTVGHPTSRETRDGIRYGQPASISVVIEVSKSALRTALGMPIANKARGAQLLRAEFERLLAAGAWGDFKEVEGYPSAPNWVLRKTEAAS